MAIQKKIYTVSKEMIIYFFPNTYCNKMGFWIMNFHFFKRKIRIRKAIINEKNYFYLVNVSLKKKNHAYTGIYN